MSVHQQNDSKKNHCNKTASYLNALISLGLASNLSFILLNVECMRYSSFNSLAVCCLLFFCCCCRPQIGYRHWAVQICVYVWMWKSSTEKQFTLIDFAHCAMILFLFRLLHIHTASRCIGALLELTAIMRIFSQLVVTACWQL